jgi:SAM-dependent methyltransferase
VCDLTAPWAAWEKVTDTCLFGGGVLERYRCPACDCIFGPQKYLDMSDEFVSLDYQMLYSHYAEANTTELELRTFESLKPKPNELYLNWGCGVWNPTIPMLRADGYDVWGYEPSASTSGFVVAHRSEISARFNGIFSNNVIEHFRDPLAQFRDFHSILATDGVMAHSTPCYAEKYMGTRFHTLFLLGRSPSVLAERTGFNIVDRVVDDEYISIVFQRN